MLNISHLSVQYTSGDQTISALQDLSLTLEKGKIYTLIGPSGCGKSTLLHTLCGLICPAQGSITLDKTPFQPQKHRVGFVPQNYSLFSWQTIRENILLASRIKKEPHDPQFLQTLLEALKLTPLLNRYPHELSGGQRQRAAIARALLLKPEILLMDEPFSALDALTREDLQTLFLQLWQQTPTTTLFVTHSIEEAIYLGQTILILNAPPHQHLQTLENPCFLENHTHNPEKTWQLNQQLRQKLKEVQP